MKVQVHSIHFDADKKLINFIQTKIDKLDRYYDNIIGGEVFLRLDKSKDMENKVAEIKVALPGREIFAKKQCKTFEEATDIAVSALKKQINKHKSKESVKPVG